MMIARVSILLFVLSCAPMSAWAASEAEAKTSLDAARAEESKAKAAKAAWTPTEAALAAATKALAARDFDVAKASADEALALARRSIQQAEEQKSAWREVVVH